MPEQTIELLTPQQLCKEYPAISQGALKKWLFNRVDNGLHNAVIKVGKRLMLDRSAFEQWLESHRENKQ